MPSPSVSVTGGASSTSARTETVAAVLGALSLPPIEARGGGLDTCLVLTNCSMSLAAFLKASRSSFGRARSHYPPRDRGVSLHCHQSSLSVSSVSPLVFLMAVAYVALSKAQLCCVAVDTVVPTKWRFASAPVVTGLPAFQSKGGLPTMVTINSYLLKITGLGTLMRCGTNLTSVTSHYLGTDPGVNGLETLAFLIHL